MATMTKIAAAMMILGKYEPDGYVQGEHDIIYLPGPKMLASEDRAELERLGVHWDGEVESWAVFT